MGFVYDLSKNRANLEKHGIDFEEAQELWEKNHVIIPVKNISDEKRYAILGKIRDKIFIAVYTLRNENIRLISCHRADKKLERVYHDLLKKKNH